MKVMVTEATQKYSAVKTTGRTGNDQNDFKTVFSQNESLIHFC